ncbi:hypothetical protein BDZ97DRAFT_1922155 [Flammula alnicola]|nr:hypothetical protein BDZ97DRAFT_1922155 [Flammula alnicola]
MTAPQWGPLLHYTLQYAMGPWQYTHLHKFSFNSLIGVGPGPRLLNNLADKDKKLKIGPRSLYEDDDYLSGIQASAPAEENSKGDSIPAGRLYNVVAPWREIRIP